MGKLGSTGLTLVEVLVAITIIAIAAAVGIPNLSKYREDQELPNVASDLVRILRQAQSSAMSHVACDGINPVLDWKVILASSTFTLSSDCQVLTPPVPSPSPRYQSPSSNVSLTLQNCSSPATGTIVFTNNEVRVDCTSGSASSPPFSILLRKAGLPDKTVIISSGGAIDVN